MTPDTSNDEAGARDHATHVGRTEDFGGGVGDQDPSPFDAPDARLRPDPWGDPPPTPRAWRPIPTDPPF